MDEFNSLYHELKLYLSLQQIAAIKQAYHFAKLAHHTQTRNSGEPYITHPLMVAYILARIRMDPPTIIAAILHDVVEDTEISQADISQHFGDEVAMLVDGVTKLTQIHFANYAQAQAENFYKMTMAMARDIRVIMIKLCDRLHNMRTLPGLPRSKQRRKVIETLEIFAPIAQRLGMQVVRVELEDLGLATLYPWRYRILKAAVAKLRHDRRTILAAIRHNICSALQKILLSTAYQVEYRGKHLYSIYQKMRQKRRLFADVMDVYRFRIIVNNIDECYQALGILHNLYKPVIQHFKDYIAIPKINGYQSLHTTLFGPHGVSIEVQIRTSAMHKIAEHGIAAYWLYQSDTMVHHAQFRAREWLREIAEMGKSTKNPLEFIEHVKTDLLPDEIYVFTPKGQIIELSTGSTPVDFAYAIHSDIGNTCVAARLNKQSLPLSTVLTSGQQVEIITAPGAKPNLAWLNFVVTGKARSNIKYYLKQQQRTEWTALGKQLTNKALQSFNQTLPDIAAKQLETIAQTLHIDSADLLFEEVGCGHRPAMLLAEYIVRTLSLYQTEHLLSPNEAVATLPLASNKLIQALPPLMIKGTEGSVISYAQCCRPIPGDVIAGLIKAGYGIEIHLAACPILLQHDQQTNQYIDLAWEDHTTGDFFVDLNIELLHPNKNLVTILLILTEQGSHVIRLYADTIADNQLKINMTITTRHRNHLAKILRKIHHCQDIARVLRCKPSLTTD